MSTEFFDIVFASRPSGEPGSGQFVEVEDNQGQSISVGQWIDRADGYCCLRIPVGEEGESQREDRIMGADQISPYHKLKNPVLLSRDERHKCAAYLEQLASQSTRIAEETEKRPGTAYAEMMKVLRTRASTMRMVAKDLRSDEDHEGGV